MEPIEKTVTLSGSTVHYWEYHSDKKPTLIMIHGFRGTHHGLARIAENLPDYHLIIPDLPGFGASSAFMDTKHSLEAYTSFLEKFINALDLPHPPILIGHSFGSIIAGHFAAVHPDVIAKLILINPIGGPALKGPRAFMTRLAISYYWLGRVLPARPAQAWLGAPPIVKIMSITMAKTKDKEMRHYIHDQHRQHFSTFFSPRVVAESFRTSVENDVSQVAHKIQLPTLLIAGEKDDITALDKQHALHQSILASDLHVISDVGHLIHYEKPTEAAAAIRAFLAK